MLGDFARTSLLTGSLTSATGFAVAIPPSPSQAQGRTLPLQGRVSEPAFSPDGRLIATVGTDGRVTLWDVATAEAAGPALDVGYETKGSSWTGDRWGWLSFSPDGRSLVWWFEDKVVVWDVATRQVIGRPAGGRSFMEFSPNGEILLLERDGFVLWSVSKRGPMGPPLTHVSARGSKGFGRGPFIRFNPDSRSVAVATKDGVILWDVARTEATGPVLKPRDDLPRLVFSPDGGTLTAESQGEVLLWDVANREAAGVLTRSGVELSQVVFSPDGRVLAWLTNRGGFRGFLHAGEILLWDVAKRKPIVPPLGSHDTTQKVEFSPDGKRMATGGSDHSVVLWDVWSGRPIGDPLVIGGKKTRYPWSGAGVLNLAFSESGETLMVTTGSPAFLELWDVSHQPPRLLRRFDQLKPVFVRSSSYSGLGAVIRGKTLAFRPNGQLALCDVSRQEPLDQPVIVPGFEGNNIAFSPDGTTLATYQDTKKGTVITLWDVATLMPPDRKR